MPARKTGGSRTEIGFYGAAGTVTGSKHLVRTPHGNVLLDCGMFQGERGLRQRNWEPCPFDPTEVDAVVLSHAHIDHTGQLPRLVREGFEGPVYCTPGTAELLDVMLRDAAYLQEEQAARANRYGFSKHRPALPLYTIEDAVAALELLQVAPYDDAFPVLDEAEVTFRRAGHILGSASVDLRVHQKDARHIVFSGDVGRWGRPILRDPEPVPHADILITESTYGDRIHPPNPEEELARVARENAERGGILLIPAFALGRTQELVWRLRQLEDAGKVPVVPVYVDSPMAIDVTRIYLRHPEDHDLDMQALADEGPLQSSQFTLCRTVEASKALNEIRGPAIIISASGMATGGRILHHLRRRLPEKRTTVLIAGFQAAGTRGRSLLEGAREIRIHGQQVDVRARVEHVNGLSAHADQEELMRWFGGFEQKPRQVYLVHGEERARTALEAVMKERLGWSVRSAEDGEVVDGS